MNSRRKGKRGSYHKCDPHRFWGRYSVVIRVVRYNGLILSFLINGESLNFEHCATSRKVADSIPDGVIWIF